MILMLHNSKKVDIFWNFCELQTKDILFEGHWFAEKREIVFLFFHTNVPKFSRKRRFHFTDRYMKNKKNEFRLSL